MAFHQKIIALHASFSPAYSQRERRAVCVPYKLRVMPFVGKFCYAIKEKFAFEGKLENAGDLTNGGNWNGV